MITARLPRAERARTILFRTGPAIFPRFIAGVGLHALRVATPAVAGSAALLLWPAPAVHAQSAEPRKSQAATVSQAVGATTITVKYIRPVARGRELFGGIVRWDREWTPGADSAALITVTNAVVINGATLEAGTYSMWAKPGPDKWIMIFSSAGPVFHIPYPGREVLRVEAVPRVGTHMEAMAFYFPVVDGRKAELVLHWGTVVVPFVIETE